MISDPAMLSEEELERLCARLEDEREEAKDLSRIGTPWDPVTAQRIANTMYDAMEAIAALTRARDEAHAQALEEAAEIAIAEAEKCVPEGAPANTARKIAAAIRAAKEQP